MKYLLLIAMAAAPAAYGQFSPSAWTPSQADCTAAIGTLQNGSLAAVDSQKAAARVVDACGTAGDNARAAAMRRRTGASLTADASAIFAPSHKDTAIMNAALDVATNSSATNASRVLSLGILSSYISGSDLMSYVSLTDAPEGDGCAGVTATQSVYSASNLAVGAPDVIKGRVASIEHDAAQPLAVRSAANCVMNAWRSVKALPGQPLLSYSSTPVSLEYVCGQTFRVKNSNSYIVYIQYTVDGGARQTLGAVPHAAGQTYGLSDFRVESATGVVRMYLDDQLIATVTGTTNGC